LCFIDNFMGTMTKKVTFTFLLACVGYAVWAQQTSDTVKLDELVVSGNRINIPFSKSNRNISLVTKEDIKALPVSNINDALSYIPGVDIRQRGVSGVQADLGIRGGTFEQTLVMINGMKLSDPQTGHHTLNLPISIESVNQIEILKGGGSRIFGQNAYCGAINIISRVPSENIVNVQLSGAEYSTLSANIGGVFATGNIRHYLSVSHDYSDGYIYNTDYRLSNLFYQSEIQSAVGSIQVMGGYTYRAFGANSFYGTASKDQWESLNTSFACVSVEENLNAIKIVPRISWRQNADDYYWIKNNPLGHNNHLSNTYSFEANATYPNILGISGMGIETRYEEVFSTSLKNHQRKSLGLYAEHRFSTKRFDFTPGINTAYYSDWGWSVFPGIDAGFELIEHLRLTGSVGRSYRIPTYTELYYNNSSTIGNINLRPELSINYELGLQFSYNNLKLGSNYFIQDASRLIDFVVVDSTNKWYAQNLNNVLKSGIEFSVQWLSKDAGDILRNFTANYTYIDAQYNQPGVLQSRYALKNIKHQIQTGIEYRLFLSLSHSVQLRYIERLDASPYWLIDTRINYTFSKFRVFADVTNLTNSHYTEVYTPMPGRWFRLGLQFKATY
jgi:vitamin B12 transporter